MELNDEFELPLPVAETWKAITDAEKVLPSVPGAELREVEGDELRGVMRVKVGTVTVSYRGDAHFESRDRRRAEARVESGRSRDPRAGKRDRCDHGDPLSFGEGHDSPGSH